MAYVGIKKGTVKHYYAYNKNGCGHAAVATVLNHYGMLKTAKNRTVDSIYARSPPDTTIAGGANCGCTPGHVENMCRLYGLMTHRFDNRAGKDAAFSYLRTSLKKNRPVIVLMDNGKLASSWGGHYIVAYGHDSSNYFCVNMINYPDASLTEGTFEKAWHMWFVPSDEFHFSGISVWKR